MKQEIPELIKHLIRQISFNIGSPESAVIANIKRKLEKDYNDGWKDGDCCPNLAEFLNEWASGYYRSDGDTVKTLWKLFYYPKLIRNHNKRICNEIDYAGLEMVPYGVTISMLKEYGYPVLLKKSHTIRVQPYATSEKDRIYVNPSCAKITAKVRMLDDTHICADDIRAIVKHIVDNRLTMRSNYKVDLTA